MNLSSPVQIADEITDFVIKESYYPSFKRDDVHAELLKHIVYGTIILSREAGEITGLVRWNWIGHNTVDVLDALVQEDKRGVQTLKHFLRRAVAIYPQIKWFIYNKRKSNARRGFAVKEWI